MTEPGDYPPFDDAIERFTAFAVREGFPGQLTFVSPADVVIRRGRLVVRVRDQRLARTEAGAQYARASKRNLGVSLTALCVIKDQTCVFVSAPDDEDEAARLMYPRGLKLSVPTDPRPARAASRLMWLLVRVGESHAARQLTTELFK